MRFLVFFCVCAIAAAEKLDWWQTTVFYQVYPRSFKDSDGDGVGDLNGVTEKLDHLKDAGIGAVWLSPIYESPMKDFGYDIADFRKIDPIFGNLDDFDKLQAKAKELGIKLILDFVPNHSSNESEWFKKSVQKVDPYTNYYVWSDGKVDDSGRRQPPNNWLSTFAGSAWEWNPERQQYYLHQFGAYQPDLNYRDPNLVQEMKDILKFWMEKGVDGFRIDAVPYLFEDKELRDEPLSGDPTAPPNEANYLNHVYTQNVPETYDMIQQWRELVDQKAAQDGKTRVLMLETYASLQQVMGYYGTEDRPGGHFPFNFLMITDLNNKSSAQDFDATVHKWMDNMPRWGWANWVLGNHDQPRVATRYGPALVDALNMMNQLLPGSAITYNGEEIGMTNLHISYEDTIDPYGKDAGPDRYELYTRDPERTPFQWDDSVSAGFSKSTKTWLPVNPNYKWLNLEAQKQASRSHYKVYQKLTSARRTPTIQHGSLQTKPLSEKVFAFTRYLEGEAPFAVVLNLGSKEENVSLKDFEHLPEELKVYTASIDSERQEGQAVSKADLTLEPYEALVLQG